VNGDADWMEQRVALPFRVGDLRLAVPTLLLRVRRGHFLERPRGLPAAPDDPPRGCAGYLFRSQPIDVDPPPLSRNGRLLQYVPGTYDRALVDLRLGYDAYLARFSGRTRSGLLRKLRRFEAEAGGAADCRVYRTGAELDEFHRLARGVSRLTYQERLLDAGLPADAAFVGRMRALGDAGLAYGFLLFLRGAPVAYLYCTAEGDALLYAHVGFDPAAAALSPGTVLQLLALRVLFAEARCRWFDFTEGEGAHKALFATESVRCADIYLLRPSLKHHALVRARVAVEAAGEAVGRTLDRLGLKTRIRTWLRRGAEG
jgi:hypothetical protein